MKTWFFIITVATVIMVGCSHQDPIDSIVKKASAEPTFPPVTDILRSLIELPATAPVAEVVSKALKNSELGGTNVTIVTILETRQVDIANNANKLRFGHSDINRCTAVLVDTSSGRKVVLLQFFPRAGRVGLWDYTIYDLPPSA